MRVAVLVAILSAPLALSQTALSADHFLIVGGGPQASNNQVSLEKNVRYVQRILAGVPREQQIYLFADGTDPYRDIHEKMPAGSVPEVNRWLALLSGNVRSLDFRFRSHELAVDGPATKEKLVATLRNLAEQLGPGDRLFLYATAHGGRGKPEANTKLYLWGSQSITVRELAAELDRFHPDVVVVLIMVQCYSGGFANVVFQGGDPAGDAVDHKRCGFFATVQTRAAAGCTPEVEEAEYREYSSYFWAALCGRTRTGQPVQQPDYDGDGHITLAEAHAYVLTHAETIDVPVKTSDAVLRRYVPVSTIQEVQTPLARLLELADPVEHAVLSALAEEFELEQADPLGHARRLLKELQDQRQQKLKHANMLGHRVGMQRRRLWNRLIQRWPELVNPWRPDVPQLIQDQGAGILEFLKAQPEFPRLQANLQRQAESHEEARRLECKWAKLQRFVRVAENVLLQERLYDSGNQQAIEHYRRIRELEAQVLDGLSDGTGELQARTSRSSALGTTGRLRR